MIRPTAFASNPETLASNAFQARAASSGDVAQRALAEFDAASAALAYAGIRVHVFAGRAESDCPDEIFPNNWVSFHADGTAVLYPLLAGNRRRERRTDVFDALSRIHGYAIDRTIDLTAYERQERYLEGTGSLVLDRINRVAYACRSPRTDSDVLAEFATQLGYDAILFDALDANGQPVYHTNVVMSVGTDFAAICLRALPDAGVRERVLGRLEASGRTVIEITLEQMHGFAANILELSGNDGRVIALSAHAHGVLGEAQVLELERHGKLVIAAIPTIETHGGGSLRCMLAEVHLPMEKPERPGR
jgi:hypothetical protein